MSVRLAPREVLGPKVKLRLIDPDDAGYIHALRTDPAYSTYLSEVTGTAEDQRRWIEGYKSREAEGLEFYYAVERRDDGTRCGVVRLYDIESDNFTWGSWILDANKPPKAALESAVLVYVIGFLRLDLKKATFDVRRENSRTIAFHQRFGAVECMRDTENIYFFYSAVEFQKRLPDYLSSLGCGGVGIGGVL